MGPQLRQKVLTLYPEWHQQPLCLSLQEIEQPQQVLIQFFDTYNLPAIRACLKQWLEDALRAQNVAAADHFFTCQHIEKLVEAAWLIHQEAQTAPSSYPAHEEPPQEAQEDEAPYTSAPQTIYRSLPFFDRIQLRSFCQVVIEQGPREGLRMEGPEAILHAIDIRVDEQQSLIIESGSGQPKEMIAQVTIFITYTEIKLLATFSTGSIRTSGAIHEAQLHIVQNGTGNLNLQAETGSLQVIIHGAGAVKASGASFHTHIITYGPGSFDGKEWQTRAATVFLSGSGDVTLGIAKRLEGSIGGQGRLKYTGTPSFKALQLAKGAAVIQLEEEKNN